MNEPASTRSLPPAHRIMAGGRRKTNEDAQPWTAARCQRLLRQLQCRLVTLRKLVNEARQTTTTRSKRHSTDNEPTRAPKRARYTYGRRRSAPAQTKTATIPLSTPPRTVRTLGTMKIERCSPDAGRVDFPSPLLRKFRNQSTMPESLPTDPESNTTTTSPSLISDLQSLRRVVPEGQYRIYEAVFGWMSSMLRSTEPLAQVAHPKSLLGMCLRKVPAAMAVIEAWDRQTAEDEGTMSMWESSKASTDLYGQLEGFGAAGFGWKPLKLVVRAHALFLLAASVSEGLLEPPFVRILVDLCLSLGCNEEAARLVSSLNCPLAAPRSASSTLLESSTVQPLGAIVRSLQGQGSFGASLECLAGLIRSKRLGPSWLTSRAFQGVWTRCVDILNSTGPAPSAVDFVCTAIEQLVLHDGKRKRPEQNTEEQTLVSVLAALAAAVWTLGAKSDGSPGSWRKQAARRMMHVLESCVSNHQKRRGAFRSSGLFTLVLARFMAVSMIDKEVVSLTAKQHASQECARLLAAKNGAPSQSQYRQTLLMACSVAQYRGRACGLPCHDVLSEICAMLDGLGPPDWFHDGLRSDGAFVLAQKTKDLRDVAFAERLPSAGKGTLEASTMFSGWRWEEGIGEWVLPSPGSKTGDETRAQEDKQQARNQTGTDRRQDRQGRGEDPRWNGAKDDDSGSSVGSDEDQDYDDKADDTDEEDEDDTSVTTVMDLDEQPDSGDELGGYAQTDVYDAVETRCTKDPRGTTNRVMGMASRSITTGKVTKRIKRAGLARTRQGTGSERLGRATRQHREDGGWEDELGMP
ncbi:hypothetical protein FZEAL_8069 [Fusarium zealandicum]|uniref:Uncharacterized protein n=1 Tax=Fusarium zealandicum TaxID=1053134 RepID=A0A8H4XHW0_9HYPO|nr:hypothetical protein FZEAL_8069 [Fusarium zealandicum]